MRCCKINLNAPFAHGEKSPRDDFWREFERARQLAVRMLNRDFPGMTSAERRFAMSAFIQFRRPE